MTTQRFTASRPVLLDIEITSGTIQVIGHDGDETVVEVRSSDDELAGAMVVEQTPAGDRDRVSVRLPSQGRGGRLAGLGGTAGGDVRVMVTVPNDSDLDLAAVSAGIRATGRFRDAEISTASGDVDLPELTGRLNLRSASGDINVVAAGAGSRIRTSSGDVALGVARGELTVVSMSADVRIRDARAGLVVTTASGDIGVDVLGGSCHGRTASGDIRVGCAVAGELRLESLSGDIGVGVAEGSTVRLDVRSLTGSLSSDIDLEDQPSEDGPGGVHVDLDAQTTSGDVRVRRAPAPATAR